MGNHSKKIAVITGATSGIGAEYATRFAVRGYDLILTGRRREKIQTFAENLQHRYGIAVDVFILELSDPEQSQTLVEKIRGIETLHVLINNAGFTSKKPFLKEEIELQLNMLRVQIETSMRLIHAAVPIMIRNKSGIIINVSSMGAFTPLAENAVYSGSKIFLKNFSESLHLQLKQYNIKVQSLFPGFTRTDLSRNLGYDMHTIKNNWLQRWMTPEEVVDISLRDLKKKDTVISIPGVGNRMNYYLTKLISRKQWYGLAVQIGKKMP
ncbi:MAG: SDR family NAD(P)-dependent oxidoreductase [Proteobacteria bacterium]|nr:SDR family NAD(P)-dependent oxidoreductase [Pseudomonadota bacterium]